MQHGASGWRADALGFDAVGVPLKQRVTGVDLIPELAKLSAKKGYGIYLRGATEESSKRAAEVLQTKYPGCDCRSYVAGDSAAA